MPIVTRIQPQGRIQADLGNRLNAKISDIWIGSQLKATLIQKYQVTTNSGVIIGAGPGGLNVSGDGVTQNSGAQIGTGDSVIGDNSNCTIFIVRRCKDTTNRGYIHIGYDAGGADRVILAMPEASSGTIGFDFGNATTGSGRLTGPAYTKDTNLETLVFVAGQTKGREIWRRGIKVASDVTAKAARNSNSLAFSIGSLVNLSPNDLVEYYMVGIVNREWSDAEIQQWSSDPYQVIKTPRRTLFPASNQNSGALAWLEQNDTTAIAATVTNTATLGWTEASDTTAITAAVITQATLGWTEASDTSAIAVTVNTGGAVINWTEQPDTYAIVVSVPTRATLGWIEENDVTAITATAIIPATATINWTEQNDTCAIIAAAVVNGGLAWTEQNDVTSITAVYAQLVTATLAWTEQSDIAGTSTFNEYFFTIMRQSIVSNSGTISNAPINRIGTFV